MPVLQRKRGACAMCRTPTGGGRTGNKGKAYNVNPAAEPGADNGRWPLSQAGVGGVVEAAVHGVPVERWEPVSGEKNADGMRNMVMQAVVNQNPNWGHHK